MDEIRRRREIRDHIFGEPGLSDEQARVLERYHTMFVRAGALLEGARNVYWRLSARANLEYFSALKGLRGGRLAARIDEIRIVRDGMLALQDRDDSNAIRNEYTWGLNLGGGSLFGLCQGYKFPCSSQVDIFLSHCRILAGLAGKEKSGDSQQRDEHQHALRVAGDQVLVGGLESRQHSG